jgi:hypothetical protein
MPFRLRLSQASAATVVLVPFVFLVRSDYDYEYVYRDMIRENFDERSWLARLLGTHRASVTLFILL